MAKLEISSVQNKFSALALAAGLCVGCGGSAEVDSSSSGGDTAGGESGGAAQACADEGAGHSTDSAMQFGMGDLNGCLSGQADVFAVHAPNHAAGSLYQVNVSSRSGAFNAELVDAGGSTLATASVEVGHDQSLYAVIASGTKAFVRLSPAAGNAQYQLSVASTPLNDPSEPNSTQAEAHPLNIGNVEDGILQSAANDAAIGADYYQILVSGTQQVTVAVEPQSGDITLDVRLLSSTGEELHKSVAANNGAAVNIEQRLKKGSYFIKVADAADGAQRAAGVGEAPGYLSEPYTISVKAQ